MSSEFDRGLKEGRIDALLEDHSRHLAKINGSIEHYAAANDKLAAGIADLASAIRSLQEGGRLAEERVKVAASTLATETERRRAELEAMATTTDRKFSKRERIVALFVTVALGLIGVYLARYA